ncbi:MAG TPA: hypothetical protein VKQ36_01475, partial [Ktedonobacterales bacterium]|nr:hypothetical protein [Ktedonobacterales bacterium]
GEYPSAPAGQSSPGMASARVAPGQGMGWAPFLTPGATPNAAPAPDPDVWLIALPLASGSYRSLEGAGRSGAIRVSRPYGHLRAIRPVLLNGEMGAPLHRGGFSGTLGSSFKALTEVGVVSGSLVASVSGPLGATTTGEASETPRRGRGTGAQRKAAVGRVSGSLGSGKRLPAERLAPQVIAAVEIESDTGLFRVERPDSVLGHNDLAWALAHMEAGEPDSIVPLPRRYLALLLTLLPAAEDPEHPEADRTWGWAHRLRGPWERGPLHPRGKLGRLIAIDPDESGQGMHRACFEVLGSDEVVWALGVPCFRAGSVYELTPLGKSSLSRWLSWPLKQVRRRAGGVERPEWEIARVVYRVGAPRWPLAGVVEPLGPMGVAG